MAATEVVKLTLETKRELEARKIHPRETIDDVIRRLARLDQSPNTLLIEARAGEAKS